MARVFIIHGWEGRPTHGWYPWLKKELESRGFQVQVPLMPDPDEPKIEEWVPFLQKTVGVPDEKTFFVGHSVGCQAILRYLETVQPGVKIGGAVFVAGWFHLHQKILEEEEGTLEIAKPWMEMPVQWETIRACTRNWVALFSDDDPFVPVTDSEIFREKLGARIIVQHNQSHFDEAAGIMTLPLVLDELLRMAGIKKLG